MHQKTGEREEYCYCKSGIPLSPLDITEDAFVDSKGAEDYFKGSFKIVGADLTNHIIILELNGPKKIYRDILQIGPSHRPLAFALFMGDMGAYCKDDLIDQTIGGYCKFEGQGIKVLCLRPGLKD